MALRIKLTALLSALFMVFAGLALAAPVASAAAPQKIVCKKQQNSGSVQRIRVGPRFGTGKEIKITLTVNYLSCKQRYGSDFARPSSVTVRTDVSGSRMACAGGGVSGGSGHFETRMAITFRDYLGKHWSIPTFGVACESDTTAVRTRKINMVPSAYVAYPKGFVTKRNMPYAKATYKVEWKGASIGGNDKVGTMVTFLPKKW